MHLIKKYANRKLYNTTDKKYISMKHISKLIRAGKDVSIIDNETGEDITASIVSNLIAKNNVKDGCNVSSGVLIQLFRKGSDAVTDYAKKYVSLWQNAFTMAEDELDGLVKNLVKNKEISLAEGSRLKKEIIGFTNSIKRCISDIVDQRITEVLNVMNLASKAQFTDLHKRISELENKIKDMEKQDR